MSVEFTLKSFTWGVFDSVNFKFKYIFESSELRWRLAQCVVVNGILFLGSSLMKDYFHFIFLPFYYLFWILPLYLISMILSLFWVQDIFDETYKISNKKNKVKLKLRKVSLFDTMANMIFRKGIMFIYLAQTMLLGLIPYHVGDVLSIIFLSWLYSYYCFEYKIFALNLNTEESIQVFEANWAYYLGFGLLFTILLYLYPGLLSSGIFALFFPFLVLLSVDASPPCNQELIDKLTNKLTNNQLSETVNPDSSSPIKEKSEKNAKSLKDSTVGQKAIKKLENLFASVRQEFSDTYLLKKSLNMKETGLIPSRIRMFYIPAKIYSILILRIKDFTRID